MTEEASAGPQGVIVHRGRRVGIRAPPMTMINTGKAASLHSICSSSRVVTRGVN